MTIKLSTLLILTLLGLVLTSPAPAAEFLVWARESVTASADPATLEGDALTAYNARLVKAKGTP